MRMRANTSVCSSTSRPYAPGWARPSTPVCARLGKTIYLRKEFHERIQRIVQTIGGNRVSLFSYVDNVLEKHFADWQGDIEREYKQRDTGIF